MTFAGHSRVSRMYSYVGLMSFACAHPHVPLYYLHVLVCHWYVIRIYSYVTYVVTTTYLYVTRMSLLCTRMSSICYSHALLCHLHVTLVWFNLWSLQNKIVNIDKFSLSLFATTRQDRALSQVWFTCHRNLVWKEKLEKNWDLSTVPKQKLGCLFCKQCNKAIWKHWKW